MVWPLLTHEVVLGEAMIVRVQPVLQGRLVVRPTAVGLPVLPYLLNACPQLAFNKGVGRSDAPIEVDGSNHRLEGIGEK